MALNVVNWNVEWATPKSRRSREILSRIDHNKPEVICLTEAHAGLLSRSGYTICAGADYGYTVTEDRRKVLLWSREPWAHVDELGADSMPPGRYVSGVTQTSLGPLTVVGVCIPWSGSRVRYTSTKRRMWQDHEQYLESLAGVLSRAPRDGLIVMGDFNQRIGQGSATPHQLRSALQESFPTGMTIATAALGLHGKRCIDHIAISADLVVESLGGVSNRHRGHKLSDHFGVRASLSAEPG